MQPEPSAQRKRILLLTTLIRLPGESPYMTNELVDEWRRRGHEIDVVVLRWDDQTGSTYRCIVQQNGVRIHYLAPTQFFGVNKVSRLVGKWGAASLVAAFRLREIARNGRYDLLYATGPCTAIAGLIWLFDRKPGLRKYVYITDFFPYAQRDLGLIPGGLIFTFAKSIENWLIRRFDAIGCMSEKNVHYLRSRFNLRSVQRTFVNPIWGPIDTVPKDQREQMRAKHDLPLAARLLLFGGQLVEGRGIEEVMAAAEIAARTAPELCFVVIGAGRLRAKVEAFALRCPANFRLLDPLPRDEYLALAAACDVGLVVTIPNTDVPTFPSRTIDYLRAGLPIVASVEASTDFGTFVSERGIGVSVLAGDANRLLVAAQELLANAALYFQCQQNGIRALNEVFDVRKSASRFLAQLQGESP